MKEKQNQIHHLDNERGNSLPPFHDLRFLIIQDGIFHGLCYTSCGALGDARNNSIDPPEIIYKGPVAS